MSSFYLLNFLSRMHFDLKKCLLILILFLTIDAQTQAGELLTGKYIRTRERVAQHDQQSRKILQALFSLAKRQKKIVSKREVLSNQVAGVRQEVRKSVRQIKILKKKMGRRREFLAGRMKTVYMLGGDGMFQWLFSSSGLHEFYENIKFANLILGQDLEWLEDQKKSLEELKKKENTLKSKVEKYASLEKDLKDEEKELERVQSLRVQVLNKIKENRKKDLISLQEMRELSEELGLREYGLDLFETAFYEAKGKLNWPVSGMVRSSFGIKQDQEYGYAWKQKGLFLDISKNQDLVMPIYKGEVVFVGILPGLGSSIILDHGDHYYSVYGNIHQVSVKKGEKVETSQKLGLIKSRSNHKENTGDLYLEVRHFSDALDPLEWLSTQRRLAKNP